MADYLGITLQAFHDRYAHRALRRWTLNEVRRNAAYDCVFLREDADGKRGCSIYPVRPTQCRTWPFWPSNLKSRSAWESSAQSCPGMRNPDARGEHFVPIEQIRVTMAKNPHHL